MQQKFITFTVAFVSGLEVTANDSNRLKLTSICNKKDVARRRPITYSVVAW